MEKVDLQRLILDAIDALSVTSMEPVQDLWSGYGKIWRVKTEGGPVGHVVVKHVKPPDAPEQPRGWNTDQSHSRKLKSYQVEAAWYRHWSDRLDHECRVASCHAVHTQKGEFVFVFEDLDASGFSHRGVTRGRPSIVACLRWLARFHCRFLRCAPTDLWQTGTYWHLETRPDELAAMLPRDELRIHAKQIDERLSGCKFPTIVHGDAKVANFCFNAEGSDVAAVDFQYVGGGCAMKDVAYFLGSCLEEPELEQHADALLDEYFAEAQRCLPADWLEFEAECRELYPIAWADFNRFLRGWYPSHQKLHRYSRKMTDLALDRL